MDDDEVRQVMRDAFEQAFQAQLGQLYKVYLTNSLSVANQAENTKRGIELAIESYKLAIAAVDAWES